MSSQPSPHSPHRQEEIEIETKTETDIDIDIEIEIEAKRDQGHTKEEQYNASQPINALLGSYDLTRWLPVDVVLYLTQFIDSNVEMIRFGRTSKSNLAGVKNFQCKGTLHWTDEL